MFLLQCWFNRNLPGCKELIRTRCITDRMPGKAKCDILNALAFHPLSWIAVPHCVELAQGPDDDRSNCERHCIGACCMSHYPKNHLVLPALELRECCTLIKEGWKQWVWDDSQIDLLGNFTGIGCGSSTSCSANCEACCQDSCKGKG